MTPDQMAKLAARLKQLSSDYAFMNAYPGAAAAMVNAADLIAGMARRVPLSDEQIYQAMDAARESYRAHTTRIRGQMLTVYDDMDWHLARAIEQAVWEKNDD